MREGDLSPEKHSALISCNMSMKSPSVGSQEWSSFCSLSLFFLSYHTSSIPLLPFLCPFSLSLPSSLHPSIHLSCCPFMHPFLSFFHTFLSLSFLFPIFLYSLLFLHPFPAPPPPFILSIPSALFLLMKKKKKNNERKVDQDIS